MIPSSSDLAYFIEAAASLNFSRASERLGIAQPSLTLAIQRLEANVGTTLFLRGKKGVVLTPAGRQLLVHARDLMQRWDDVKGQVLASTDAVQGRFSIGCHVSVALYTLPTVIAELMESHPHLEVKLVHDLSRKITERVIAMEIDVGIAVNPVRHPDLIVQKLMADEVSLWVGKGQSSIQNFKSGEGVLIADFDLVQTQDLLKKLKRTGIRFRRVVSSSSLEVVAELTAGGAGIGILPGRVAERAHGLKPVPHAPSFQDEICLLYRVENKNVKAVRAIAGKLKTRDFLSDSKF